MTVEQELLDILTTIDKTIRFDLVTACNCMSYKYTDSTDGYLGQARLELKLIYKNYDKLREIETKVKQKLITNTDDKLTNKILNIVQNGGGLLFNESTQTYHLTIYFDIKCKFGGNE